MLLTRDQMNLTHFSSRKRYIKDESGQVVETRYDRLLIGLRVAGRDWLASHYDNQDDIVTTFMLGDKNIVFTYRKGDSVMYVNRKAGAQAMEYAHYWADNNDCEMVFVDDLPTAIHTRTGGGRKVESMDDLIEKSLATDVDCGL